MFANCLDFNADLSKWNVARVQAMTGMFRVDVFDLQAPAYAKFRDIYGAEHPFPIDHTDGSHFNGDIR